MFQFGAQACHGTAHKMYYILIYTCGIWHVASSPMRFVTYHVCAMWLPKTHLQTQSCAYLCRTRTIQSGVQGRQLSHGNLNFVTDSSSCSSHLSSEKKTLCWLDHSGQKPFRRPEPIEEIVGNDPVEQCSLITQITTPTSWKQSEGPPNSNQWPLIIPESVTLNFPGRDP